MRTKTIFLATAVAAGVAVTTINAAMAQDMQGTMGPGMMQGGKDQDRMGRGMMRNGPANADRGMEQCMMMMHGGMGSGMMGSRGMMGSGMMQGRGQSGMDGLFGSRVRPIMNLSVDDVRGYLDFRLERLNNKRLKVGDLKSDDGTITADIVTVDNSLVQRLKVDRHTGAIEYTN
jgi:hypothetical protein